MSRTFAIDSSDTTGSGIHAESAPSAEISFTAGGRRRRAKRAVDVIVALFALVVFGPAMFFTAVLIRAGGGPAFFRQERIGKDGTAFYCLKFRTMCVDADEVLRALLERDPEAAREWRMTHKLNRDPRVTWIGRFLRKSSIDELPQLINVLRGEMSIVGPRPIVRQEIERYGDKFAAYTSVLPGITGLWQISGRSDVSYEERVQMDMQYVRDWSLLGDIKIILRTIPAVILADGAK